MERWQNKVAVITGASSGIGAAICALLVECGLKVVGLARRKEKIEELAKSLGNKTGKLYAVKTDVTKESDILNAFEWITKNVGPVHILVNCAGVYKKSDLLDGKTETWKLQLDTNLMGLCIATREAAKIMRENNVDGHIIHINSINGHYVSPNFKSNLYGASKFGITFLTEALRLELNAIQSKIKITSISPGIVKTGILSESGVSDAIFSTIPYLEPHDIAETVRYILGTPPHVQVVGLARRKEKIEELAKSLKNKSGKLLAVRADVTKESDIINAFDWITNNVGPVHILINNAGAFKIADLLNGKTELWKLILDTNIMGLCIATREATRIMKENNIDGHIIHINSLAGHYVPPDFNLSVYGASKSGVTFLTEALRLELNAIKSKTKITSISPGVVKTEILKELGLPDEILSSMACLEPKDIADAVRYVLGTPPHVQVHEVILRPKIEQSKVEQEEKLIKTEFKIKQEFENRIQPKENKVQLLETDIDTIRIECSVDKNSVEGNISQIIDEVDRLNNDVSFVSKEIRPLNIERNKTKQLISKPNLLLQVTDDKPKFDRNKKGLHPIKFIRKLENYHENFRIEGIHQVHTALECLEADVRILAEMHMNE
ncbi:hypothetical protein RN001_007532 [Aquatica leii]|uniref:Dehydrogenase/reductase SDR family member 11 n=1 Tax=Aquatica leii TaxID=1421715 RepID=A0AAN7PBU4_9COLE|nr:hypothetical protein RN001_007532 [Aquatica leii]